VVKGKPIGKSIMIHSPECFTHEGKFVPRTWPSCCMDPALGETVSLKVYRFDELSPEAKKVAIEGERQSLEPAVKEMVEAYINQACRDKGVFPVEIMKTILPELGPKKSWHPDFGSDLEKYLYNPPQGVRKVAEDILRVITDESSQALSDDAVIEHIKADNLRFLADGTLWLYADKETS
jgi:hypothetical protein